MNVKTNTDFLVLSHLRWNFVYQRPQHLISRMAQRHRVFFVEEPIFEDTIPRMVVSRSKEGVLVAVPHLPMDLSQQVATQMQALLLDQLIIDHDIQRYHSWYYTPMALKFSRHLRPEVCIYDCMDQLSHFLGAPKEIAILERELMKRSNLVFTGGQSLYEDKRHMHPMVYPFPSAVDMKHFSQARSLAVDPDDQAAIPEPRIGYLGVIDERIDLALIDKVAALRPDWQLVMVGPVVKIDPATLPRRPNIHYLGGKTYGELPAYLAGWDVAMLPFARNDATKFISPTKTPEYLAAGCQVVSTSIRDVVRPYGDHGLVRIADEPQDFVNYIQLALDGGPNANREAIDAFLANISWDQTFESMYELIEDEASEEFKAMIPMRAFKSTRKLATGHAPQS